jgi:hypothetical protein
MKKKKSTAIWNLTSSDIFTSGHYNIFDGRKKSGGGYHFNLLRGFSRAA